MENFIDELNLSVSQNVATTVAESYESYVNNVLFPYWIEREYERIVKQEISNRVARGEYTIENGKKVVAGEIRYINWKGTSEENLFDVEVNKELIQQLSKMGLENSVESYGDKLKSIVDIRPTINGNFYFYIRGVHSQIFHSIIEGTHTSITTESKREGLFKREKTYEHKKEVRSYELEWPLKTVCKAFAERGKKDFVEIAFEIKGINGFVAKMRNFDEKIISDVGRYEEDDYTSHSCLTYRIEF